MINLLTIFFLSKKLYEIGFSSKNVSITSKKSHFGGDSWGELLDFCLKK